MPEPLDKCCYEWHFEDVCFADKRGFASFVNDRNLGLRNYYRIDKNRGTEIEKKFEDNTFIWTNNTFDVFMTSSDSPLYDRKPLACKGNPNSVLVRKIDILGEPEKVKRIAAYLKQQASMVPSEEGERRRQSTSRKNVVGIRNESACKKIA